MTFDTPDLINGCIELFGAYLTWRNAWQLRVDRQIRGVYWPTTFFFAVWGLWNLYYYPALEQWASFAGGVVLVAGNIAWVCMAIRLKLNQATDQARPQGVACTNGLCGNGSEVSVGDTAMKGRQ